MRRRLTEYRSSSQERGLLFGHADDERGARSGKIHCDG